MTVSNKELKLKEPPRADNAPRTVSGAQLSSSGEHLSTTGSGIRRLFENEPTYEVVAATEEMTRPKFRK